MVATSHTDNRFTYSDLHNLADVIMTSGMLPDDADGRKAAIERIKAEYKLNLGGEHHTDPLNRPYTHQLTPRSVAEFISGTLIQSGDEAVWQLLEEVRALHDSPGVEERISYLLAERRNAA